MGIYQESGVIASGLRREPKRGTVVQAQSRAGRRTGDGDGGFAIMSRIAPEAGKAPENTSRCRREWQMSESGLSKKALDGLESIFGRRFSADVEDRVTAAYDATKREGTPAAVVWPATTEEVSAS